MNMKKNTTLTLSVSPAYVSKWGFWEALREFVQNGMDAHERGYALRIERGGGKSKAIKVRNEGADLGRETLLLGTTDKRGVSGQRGGFGEGYKLAALVLTRMGFGVQIRTQSEYWDFELAHSAEFGAETLQVKIKAAPVAANYVEVRITASDVMEESDWDALWLRAQERMLDVPGLAGTEVRIDDYIAPMHSRERVLVGPQHRGRLYCSGLYVGQLPDADYQWGYDLSVALDRDRQMADPWSLRSGIARLLEACVSQGLIAPERLWDVVASNSSEGRALAENTWAISQVSESFVDLFKEKHGENAVPVASLGEADRAEHTSLRAVTVPKQVQALLEHRMGTLESAIEGQRNSVRSIVQLNEMTSSEVDALRWSVRMVQGALRSMGHDFAVADAVQVVVFGGDILGLYKDGEIKLARSQLARRSKALAVLAHEVGHHFDGGDNARHNRFTEELLATVAENLASAN